MTLAKSLASALESFGGLLALFVAHRLLSLDALSPTDMTPTLASEAITVGLLSDFWVAFLGALLTFLISAPWALLGCPATARTTRAALLAAFALAIAGHQAYVDFYHAQISPFHLRYLLDSDFIGANGGSLFTLKPMMTLLVFVVAYALILKADLFKTTSLRRLAFIGIALAMGSLIAHNRNIHWRVQWFIHDNLQVNPAERLYLRFAHASTPDPLLPEEISALALALGQPMPPVEDTTSANTLFGVLSKPASPPQGLTAAGASLKAQFRRAIEAGMKPVVAIVMLESLRPSETGYFAPSRPSLTPFLDGVARHGIVFTNAYSTGSVTRGGQEAALCGYLGSRETSLLRGSSSARMKCLPELANEPVNGLRGEMFWYHGGEGRFDNQLEFWAGRGIGHTLSLKDFPKSAAATGWGVGDVTFFREAAARLKTVTETTTADYVFGLALSVSNHIPWSVPPDALPDQQSYSLSHPSQATTRYSDQALGQFFDDLRRSGLWERSLLVIVSDHGNNITPYADIYENSSFKELRLQSHVNFVLTGGLAERTLEDLGADQLIEQRPISQASTAPLIADLIGLSSTRFLAEHPFAVDPKLPVLAILEDQLFDPSVGQGYPLRSAARKPATARDDRLVLRYFRAFLQFTNTRSGDILSGP